MDARTLSTGEVVFRDSLAHGVAGIVQADYCLDGREQLIVVSVGGEVRGYLPASAELRQQVADATFEQDTVRELSHKKQASRRGISWQLYFRTRRQVVTPLHAVASLIIASNFFLFPRGTGGFSSALIVHGDRNSLSE